MPGQQAAFQFEHLTIFNRLGLPQQRFQAGSSPALKVKGSSGSRITSGSACQKISAKSHVWITGIALTRRFGRRQTQVCSQWVKTFTLSKGIFSTDQAQQIVHIGILVEGHPPLRPLFRKALPDRAEITPGRAFFGSLFCPIESLAPASPGGWLPPGSGTAPQWSRAHPVPGAASWGRSPIL